MRDSYVNGALIVMAAPASAVVRLRYGSDAGRRFGVGVIATLAAQQALVGLARRHAPAGMERRRLTLVDLMTLSRGVSAATLVGLATSGVRDRRGPAGWVAWLSTLYGAIACDWLDGPIARRLGGTSEFGEVLDLEADSWLTLCMAWASVLQGELPGIVAIPPLLRYGVALHGLLNGRSGARLFEHGPGWSRHLGMAQSMLFIAALAPFGGPVTRRVVRIVAPIQTPVQAWSVLRSGARGNGA